jgi:hypothetical protein
LCCSLQILGSFLSLPIIKLWGYWLIAFDEQEQE